MKTTKQTKSVECEIILIIKGIEYRVSIDEIKTLKNHLDLFNISKSDKILTMFIIKLKINDKDMEININGDEMIELKSEINKLTYIPPINNLTTRYNAGIYN